MLFIKIITFPIRLVLLISAYILRGALSLIGLIICYISELAGILLKIVGVLTDFLAIFMTYTAIKEIKAGELALKTGIFHIVGFWILTILFNTVSFAGYMVGQFLIDIGETITDFFKELLFI